MHVTPGQTTARRGRGPLPRLQVVTIVLALTLSAGLPGTAAAGPKSDGYWSIDDVRPGMRGVGKSVFQGTKISEFTAEVLGVLRNVGPGRDVVLVRLSGCELEKTGVIAGMSGSPVYIDGKLLGAVAFGYQFAKDPIAGITPIRQMIEVFEQRQGGDGEKTRQGMALPKREKGEKRRASHLQARAGEQYPAAVVAVRRLAGDQHEGKHGQELRQPHHPHKERAGFDAARQARDGIDLPPDGYALRQRRGVRQNPARPQQNESGIAKSV